jgi:phosphotransferase system  glucose/maltose/N-acetylglucosamine-specific IIC component
MEFLILLIAPVLQIIASIMRITEKLNIRLIYIALLAFILGIAFDFILAGIIGDELRRENYHCSMPMVGTFIVGLLVIIVAVPVIGGISYLVYRDKRKTVDADKLSV